jgi:uncharacterized paraquat-inducible protein A
MSHITFPDTWMFHNSKPKRIDPYPNKKYIHCPKCGVGQYDFNKSCFKCGCKLNEKK